MVEEVKLFLVAWMQKNIQIKLIHFLGGISKNEAATISHNSFHQGKEYGRTTIKHYFISVEKQIYGKSKQDWIDIIHKAIKNL